MCTAAAPIAISVTTLLAHVSFHCCANAVNVSDIRHTIVLPSVAWAASLASPTTMMSTPWIESKTTGG